MEKDILPEGRGIAKMTASRSDQDQRSRFASVLNSAASPPPAQPAAVPNYGQQRELLPNLSIAEAVARTSTLEKARRVLIIRF